MKLNFIFKNDLRGQAGVMADQLEIFQRYVKQKGLHRSLRRERVAGLFLQTKTHSSVADFYQQVKRRFPGIGHTTVYRTLKLVTEAGLGEMVDFNDGVKRFERKIGREYHAHLICVTCGKDTEVFDKRIAALSARLAAKKNFLLEKHRYELFGRCVKCRRQEKKR